MGAVAPAPRQRRISGNPLVLLAVMLFFGVLMTATVTYGIWPGEAKLTAPLLCPPGQPDAFVVEDIGQVQSRTTFSWTLMCVGPTGQYTDVGFLRPTLLLVGLHAVVALAATLLVTLVVVVGLKLRGPPRATGPGG